MDWLDQSYVKYWAWLFLPGHSIFYLWIGLGFFATTALFDPEIEKKIPPFTLGVFMILVGFWFLLGTYHVMWIDIKKHFIPYQLSKAGDEVLIKGLYLKQDRFSVNEIENLTTFEVYTHWFKRVHTLFLPNVEHYKLLLKDGRAYHFHGNSSHVKAMLVELTGITELYVGEE